MQIRPFQPRDEPAVIALWEQCGLTRPWNDPRKDIARKVAVQPELFLVGLQDGRIMATVMAGYEGHRGWVNYLAVAPEHRSRGFGQALMAEVERLLVERGCPKVCLLVRTSNTPVLEFYRSLGYAQDEAVSLGKRLIDDTTNEAETA
jgi:ribosomal protein S18 acetylase RimI-like enzyme